MRMTPNLLELVEGYLTPEVISKISGLVGESPNSTQKALGTIVPSLTAAACHQASTPSGAARLMDLLSVSNLGSIPGNFGGMLSGGSTTDSLMRTGSSLISGVLGDKGAGVAALIAEPAGMRPGSALSLMNLA